MFNRERCLERSKKHRDSLLEISSKSDEVCPVEAEAMAVDLVLLAAYYPKDFIGLWSPLDGLSSSVASALLGGVENWFEDELGFVGEGEAPLEAVGWFYVGCICWAAVEHELCSGDPAAFAKVGGIWWGIVDIPCSSVVEGIRVASRFAPYEFLRVACEVVVDNSRGNQRSLSDVACEVRAEVRSRAAAEEPRKLAAEEARKLEHIIDRWR